jgi:SRSO17 transposase
VGIAHRFISFQKKYSTFFQTKTRNVTNNAKQCLKGIIQAKKKNMERMAEKAPESDEQSLQHFLSNSPWDGKAVIKQIAADANRNLGGKAQSALYIDDTGFAKKGKKSVGVHRQWIGRLGKAENCQVGVFAALGCKKHVQPIDFRLYLPEAWRKDKKRQGSGRTERINGIQTQT